MRLAVVGGTGFVGRHVTKQLVEAGEIVTVVARGVAAGLDANASLAAADRNDPASLRRALAMAEPALVIDMIAYRKQDIDELLAVLPSSVKRLVVISSGDVYAAYGQFLGRGAESSHAIPYDERACLRSELFPYRAQARGPDDLLYSYEKILVERAANAWTGGAATVLRLPMVYGPNDEQRRVARYLDRIRAAEESIRLNDREAAWRCTRGYVEDIAAAITLAALSPSAANEVFNLGEPEALTEACWARAIGAAAGWDGRVVADPLVAPSLAVNWNVDLAADTQRIRQALRYREPIGREQGLRRTVTALHAAAAEGT